MIIQKEFRCTTENIDKVVVELAKEIADGWSIKAIKDYSYELSVALKSYPTFSVVLERKTQCLNGCY